MHTMDVGTANVPAFLTKLWKLVEDPTYADLISWSPNGRSFVIRNPARFSKELLPLYFKHNNMASFIRQLNMYGFRKLTSIENSGLRSDKDDMEFYHQYFLKQQENLLEYIKRKASSSSSQASSSSSGHCGSGHHNHGSSSNHSVVVNGRNSSNHSNNNCDTAAHGQAIAATAAKVEEVQELLAGVMQRQDSQENFRVSVSNEYGHLWKEIAYLRQQNAKQQTIVQRLIQFLMSLVQNQNQNNVQRNVTNKRKGTLMIDDVDGSSLLPPHPAKRLNLEAGPSAVDSHTSVNQRQNSSPNVEVDIESNKKNVTTSSKRSEQAIKTGIIQSIASGLSNGPVIHDVTDDILDTELEAGANSNPIISMSGTSADISDQSSQQGTCAAPPIFQDLDLEILTQVLGLAGANQNQQRNHQSDCSPKASLPVPTIIPDQLLALGSGLNDLVSTFLPNYHKTRTDEQQQQGSQERPESAADYWNAQFDGIPNHIVPSIVPNAQSPVMSSGPEIVEPPDFLLDTNSLLEAKDDLILLPGISDGVTSDTHVPVMLDDNSTPLSSTYGLCHRE